MNKRSTILLFGIFFACMLHGQDKLIIPESYQKRVSPFVFTQEHIELGEGLYNANCKSCHGDPGQENYIELDPLPGDPASAKIQSHTDGEIFYWLVVGRGLMPRFRDILSDEERWHIIAYLRSYNADYVQPDIAALPEAFAGEMVFMDLQWLDAEKEIHVQVRGLEGKDTVPVEGAEVNLLAKRYFGDLPLGDPQMTSEEGIAVFVLPDDLPGDRDGRLLLTARLLDEEQYGPASDTATFVAGVPTAVPSLTEERAMWNTMKKAPIWLLATYTLVVAGVWATIFYIISLLLKIRKAANQAEDKKLT